MEFQKEIFYVGNAPEKLAAETLKKREIKIASNKLSLSEKIRKTDFKYYCSVCLIIRDENEYLEEWLKWHIGQGVEHFYIYDHGSRNPVKDFVKSLGAETSEKITVIDWSKNERTPSPKPITTV